MKYDKYVKRMQRLNKFVNALYKMRHLIFSVVLVSTITLVTVESIKGNVTISGTEFEFTFGDEVSFETSALMNSSYLQYKGVDDEEWKNVAPIYPGDYLVRGVSKNGFGKTKYSEELSFVINKREAIVEIAQTQVQYGYKPNAHAILNGQDKLDTEYTVTYEKEHELTTDAWVDATSVKILNSNNEDITFCYEISTPKRTVSILPRNITVKFADNYKVFDGERISTFNGELVNGTSLVEGDEIRYGDEITNLTEDIYENAEYSKEISIFNGEKDVTSFYNITVIKGKLSVGPIPLAVSSSSYKGVYDGKPLEEKNVFTYQYEQEKLLEGDELVVTFDNEEYKTNIGIIDFENTYSVKVMNGDKDVTSHYAITKEAGEVSVEKLALKLTIDSDSKIFDGDALSKRTYKLDKEIPSTDILTIDENLLPSVTYFEDSPIENKPFPGTFIKVMNGDLNVTNCYDIEVVPGSLSISKRKIKFIFKSFGDITYDSLGHNMDVFDILVDESDPILENVTPVLASDTEYAIKCGTYSSSNNIELYINDVDVTNCFDISYEREQSKISQREINPVLYFVENNDSSVIYNGALRDIQVKFGSNEIQANDKAVFGENQDNVVSRKFVNEAGYSLSSLGFDIVDLSGNSVLDQYIIKSENKIFINKKEITIGLPSINIDFDGDEHTISFDDIVLDTGDLVTSDHEGKIKYAGDEYDFLSSYVDIENEDNYIIIFETEKETSSISKKPLAIEFDNFDDFEYDGREHELTCDVSPLSDPLPSGYTIKLNSKKIKDVGEYKESDFIIDIVDIEGNPQTDNFEITTNFEEFSVTPYKLSITFTKPDPNIIYDGFEHTFDSYNLSRNDLPLNEDIKISNFISKTDAGEYDWVAPKVEVTVNGVVSVEAINNYSITYSNWDKVKIESKHLNLEVYDFEETFTGKTFWKAFQERLDNAKKTGMNYPVKITENNLDVTSTYLAGDFNNGKHFSFSYKDTELNFAKNKKLDSLLEVHIVDNLNKAYDENFGLVSTFGMCNYNKYIAKVSCKSFDDIYSKKNNYLNDVQLKHTTSQILACLSENEVDKEFLANYAINSKGVFYSFTENPIYENGTGYSISFNKENLGFVLKTNVSTWLDPDCYDFNFVNYQNVYKITKKPISISFKKQTSGNPALEIFEYASTALENGDVLYLYNPDSTGAQLEEVSLTKSSYSLVKDMGRGTISLPIFQEGGKIIKDFNFKVFTDGGARDITSCYSISYSSDLIVIL